MNPEFSAPSRETRLEDIRIVEHHLTILTNRSKRERLLYLGLLLSLMVLFIASCYNYYNQTEIPSSIMRNISNLKAWLPMIMCIGCAGVLMANAGKLTEASQELERIAGVLRDLSLSFDKATKKLYFLPQESKRGANLLNRGTKYFQPSQGSYNRPANSLNAGLYIPTFPNDSQAMAFKSRS